MTCRLDDPRETQLYRCFDDSRHLLYIGVTVDLDRRLQCHSTQSEWHPLMATVTAEPYPNRGAALRAEWHAIGEELPLFNVADNPVHLARVAMQSRRENLVESRDLLLLARAVAEGNV